MKTLTLASASPARLQVLRNAGISPAVRIADIDEAELQRTLGELSPEEVVIALAEAKLQAVLAAGVDTDLVVACDSMLLIDGKLCGKPHTAKTAIARWQTMRGHSGVLITGHAVAHTGHNKIISATASTTVHFANLDDAEIAAYVATGEPLEVAGAFTIDSLGGAFVERIEGDHNSVIGISLPLLRRLVRELGVSWPELWDTTTA